MGEFQIKRLAIVMVDAFKLPPLVVMNIDHELSNMGKVLAEAGNQSVPVFEILTADPNTPGVPAEPTHPRLAHFRNDYWQQIVKPSFDAFDGTNLLVQLRALGITEIILMGFNQSTCVRMTAESALLQGFQVYTSFDVMQGISNGYCEVTKADGTVELEGPVNCDFSNSTEVRPVEFVFDSIQKFYKKHTVLFDSYRDLPIFWQKVCQK